MNELDPISGVLRVVRHGVLKNVAFSLEEFAHIANCSHEEFLALIAAKTCFLGSSVDTTLSAQATIVRNTAPESTNGNKKLQYSGQQMRAAYNAVNSSNGKDRAKEQENVPKKQERQESLW